MSESVVDPVVFVGIDMAKADHYAQAISRHGVESFKRLVHNDQAAIEELFCAAGAYGKVVVDQPASGAQLLLSLAANQQVPVAHVTGLQMRRAADLYTGSAKTDPVDAFVLADFARRNTNRLTWQSVTDDLLVELRVFNGRDVDLAADATDTINRVRDVFTAISPALERVVGSRSATAASATCCRSGRHQSC